MLQFTYIYRLWSHSHKYICLNIQIKRYMNYIQSEQTSHITHIYIANKIDKSR